MVGDDTALTDINPENDLTLASHHFREADELSQEEDKHTTLDLSFRGGIDWKAFLLSFKSLQAKYGEHNLVIQAIEHRSDRLLIVRLAVLAELDATDITRHAEKYYRNQLSALKSAYSRALHATDEQLAIHWRHGIDLLEIVKLQAAKPVLVESEPTSMERGVSPKAPRATTENTSPANGSSHPQIRPAAPAPNTNPTHPSVWNLTLPPQQDSISPTTKSTPLTPDSLPLSPPTRNESPTSGNKPLYPTVRSAALNPDPDPVPPPVSKVTPIPGKKPLHHPPFRVGEPNSDSDSIPPRARNISPIPGAPAPRQQPTPPPGMGVAPTLDLDPIPPSAKKEDPSPGKESAPTPGQSPPKLPRNSPKRPANLGLDAYEPPQVDSD